jgi:hypothetical protein
LDFFLTNSRTFQDFQGPWGPWTRLLQVVNSLFQTCRQIGKSSANYLTSSCQTCYKMRAFCVCTCDKPFWHAVKPRGFFNNSCINWVWRNYRLLLVRKFGLVSYVIVCGGGGGEGGGRVVQRNLTSPLANRPPPGTSPTKEQAVFRSTQSQCERHQLVQSVLHLHIFSLRISYATLHYSTCST